MKKGLFFVISFLLISVWLYGAHNITNVDVIDQLGPESIPELIEVIRDPDPRSS